MSKRLVDFFALAARLKTLKRAGWQRCGVQPCESVAEHTFGVALLALLAPGDGLDRERCVSMAIVHDLAESIVGDLTPHDSIEPGEKHRRERAAMEEITTAFGERRVIELWEEFEAGETPEARIVRDLDVIEMAWQAREYERMGQLTPTAAAGFIHSAAGRIRTAAGQELLDVVLGRCK